ncbi:hypothetical protein PAPYR_6694 [Paratrimastix pyriformis]|uniref:Uncharacterized protein n=1 Tax=Paratrimastix pyriformis TaxID=342808 RepID=A0ABQ8UER1_9EUKA|nr:hypothetical protein PAPYR_6694 [Paratrimastix pyriformis]
MFRMYHLRVGGLVVEYHVAIVVTRKLMEENARRRESVRQHSMEMTLQTQQPFSFYERDKAELCSSLLCSHLAVRHTLAGWPTCQAKTTHNRIPTPLRGLGEGLPAIDRNPPTNTHLPLPACHRHRNTTNFFVGMNNNARMFSEQQSWDSFAHGCSDIRAVSSTSLVFVLFSRYFAQRQAAIETRIRTPPPRPPPFRANPIPVETSLPLYERMMTEAALTRQARVEERAQLLRDEAALPPRMQQWEETVGRNKREARKANAERSGMTPEHTFHPAVNDTIPNYKRLQEAFKKKLTDSRQQFSQTQYIDMYCNDKVNRSLNMAYFTNKPHPFHFKCEAVDHSEKIRRDIDEDQAKLRELRWPFMGTRTAVRGNDMEETRKILSPKLSRVLRENAVSRIKQELTRQQRAEMEMAYRNAEEQERLHQERLREMGARIAPLLEDNSAELRARAQQSLEAKKQRWAEQAAQWEATKGAIEERVAQRMYLFQQVSADVARRRALTRAKALIESQGLSSDPFMSPSDHALLRASPSAAGAARDRNAKPSWGCGPGVRAEVPPGKMAPTGKRGHSRPPSTPPPPLRFETTSRSASPPQHSARGRADMMMDTGVAIDPVSSTYGHPAMVLPATTEPPQSPHDQPQQHDDTGAQEQQQQQPITSARSLPLTEEMPEIQPSGDAVMFVAFAVGGQVVGARAEEDDEDVGAMVDRRLGELDIGDDELTGGMADDEHFCC